MSLRTPLGRARGLGSAKGGTHHWWMQRLTAVALLPLVIWFIVAMIGRLGADHAAISTWLAAPLPAVLMILFIVAMFHHAQLGLQVVIEDYVHSEGVKFALLTIVKLASIAFAVAGVFAVFKVAF
jgi:succinate dehydrogenase / fumarate reductase membrane anchor subunit